MKLSLVISFAFVIAVVSIVGVGIGMGQSGMAPPDMKHDPAWYDYVGYVFQNMGFFFTMMAFNISGMPSVFQTLLIVPFIVGLAYVVLTLIRGGG